ncbi:MAG: substrate-binding domain-containing protein [Pseudomonadota bacterium]
MNIVFALFSVTTLWANSFSAAPVDREPDVRIAGSSTVAPFTKTIATLFSPEIKVIVIPSGTTAGFAAFCPKEVRGVEIAAASRTIKASERARCARVGIEQLVEINLGKDGIVIAQSDKNKSFTLTARDIYLGLAHHTPQSQNNCTMVTNHRAHWNDVRASLPKREILVFGPPSTSGTRDMFLELAMERGARSFPCLAQLEQTNPRAFKAVTQLRKDGVWVDGGENDNAIGHTLSHIPHAIGIFGFSRLHQMQDISAVAFENILPTPQTISDRSYGLSRELYLYTSGKKIAAKPALEKVLERFFQFDAIGPSGKLTRLGLVTNEHSGQAVFIDTATGEKVRREGWPRKPHGVPSNRPYHAH